MADDVILTPGGGPSCDDIQPFDVELYLQIANMLGEFETEDQKAIARNNLGVDPSGTSYSKLETDTKVNTTVSNAMQQHLLTDDPHGILPQVDSRLVGMVKDDGSTPFLAPQTGQDPLMEYHLTTKRFVTTLLNNHIAQKDPHNTMSLVNDALALYVKASEVYLKGETYNKGQIDQKFTGLVKQDGSLPFTKPQMGIDPQLDGHLSTKRYVDAVMFNHLASVDPHGFLTILNQRLANYYKKTETYSKAETYSRTQLDTIIQSLVTSAANEAIQEHVNQYDPHHTLQEVDSRHYVKQDGTTPFATAQKGKPAVNDDELVTLAQLNDLSDVVAGDVVWKTSGPVQTTVGFVEDNSIVPPEMTLQEIMDAIFYGRELSITSPEYAAVGESVPVDIYVHGTTAQIQNIEIYQNDELIGIFQYTDLDNGHIQIMSNPIYEDTTFKVIVYYMNGTTLEATSLTKVGLEVFTGILPQWKTGSTVSYEYLLELITEDPTNNSMHTGIQAEVIQSYNFSSPAELKHLFVATPKSYPDLTLVTTPSQQFTPDAFNYISDIPFQVPGLGEVIYKLYIYKEALVKLNIPVTYKF